MSGRLMLAAALAACKSEKDAPSGDLSDAETDTDTDTDTDSDTDTDTDTDSDTDTTTGSCGAAIPSDAIVIDTDTALTDDDVVAWVCKNATLSLSGAGGTVFVARNGSLVLSGDSATIYAEASADLAVFSTGNTLWVESGADLLDEGGGNAQTVCDTVIFDTTEAPEDGC